MDAFPAFFGLSGRRVVIAGEGEGADARARLLASSPAQVDRIVGPAAFDQAAYAGARLALIAHPDVGYCEQAAAAARAAGALVNVLDHPELSDFTTPAIIDRGTVVAAIGTTGAAPMLSALLRADLEAKIPIALGPLAELFGRLRGEIRVAFPDLAQRRAFLRAALSGPVAEAAEAGDLAGAEQRLRTAMLEGHVAAGRVWLIVEPPTRDLLTLKAARALAEADVLVLGEATPNDLATLARRDALRRRLQDADADSLAREAAEGRRVAVVAPAGEIGLLAVVLADLGAPHETIAAAPA